MEYTLKVFDNQLIWGSDGKKRGQNLITVYCLLFLGLFDHYFLTIQQGMLMVSMVLGLTFASFWKEQSD